MISIVGWVTCEKAILLMSPFILSNAIKLAGEKIAAIGRKGPADAAGVGRAGVAEVADVGRAGHAGVAILGPFHPQSILFSIKSMFGKNMTNPNHHDICLF